MKYTLSLSLLSYSLSTLQEDSDISSSSAQSILHVLILNDPSASSPSLRFIIITVSVLFGTLFPSFRNTPHRHHARQPHILSA
ncbi:uncharacterized protein BDZ83DRAFT_441768 [Colletotrichum acutatum]|uniref:Uncharacterized protein n=1 Tax=Glomerella acutata TaxID=27357 RepID=A0AAD8XC81_GLOAC|nr:uncharacterized protein BDZ83DRAFT_441768 [Colletotrichum acutatum]KAK1720416.1 hypothetical protein BDZ83DRAFT_441768 [Colletotrichum acutatum]